MFCELEIQERRGTAKIVKSAYTDMRKIKMIFNANEENFEDLVNEFIKDKEIIDIKFTPKSGDKNNGADITISDKGWFVKSYYNAMIIYENKS